MDRTDCLTLLEVSAEIFAVDPEFELTPCERLFSCRPCAIIRVWNERESDPELFAVADEFFPMGAH